LRSLRGKAKSETADTANGDEEDADDAEFRRDRLELFGESAASAIDRPLSDAISSDLHQKNTGQDKKY
jgi:hypothetical protein